MAAVSAHCFDGEPAPPELSAALTYQRWGVGDVMALQAGVLPRVNVCLNVYTSVRGYLSTGGKTVEWTRHNPDAWRIVSTLIMARKETRRNAKQITANN